MKKVKRYSEEMNVATLSLRLLIIARIYAESELFKKIEAGAFEKLNTLAPILGN